MQVIDLSHPIASGMPVWPGTQGPEFLPVASIAVDGYAERRLSLSSHTGTHIDTPAHILEGGATIDSYPADRFIGGAVLVPVPELPDGFIGLKVLGPFMGAIETAEFVLFHTGWSRFWGDASYDEGYPVLDAETASLLSALPLKGVGMDSPSFDRPEAYDLPVHRRLLESGILLVENLTSLHRLPQAGFRFAVFPPAFSGGEASPVRAVALI